MTALETQKLMNDAYEKRSYKKAFKLYVELCAKREIENLPILRMPNLVQRAEDLNIEVPAHIKAIQPPLNKK